MAQLMLLNPRRARKAGPSKRRRKMTAKQLKYFGPRKSRTARGAPTKRKAKKAAKPSIVIVSQNPRGKTAVAKKRRQSKSRKAKVFTHKAVRRFRRNPRSIEKGFVNNTLVPAAIGAAGAFGADMLLSYLPIPQQYRSGPLLPVLRIAAALLVGAAVGALSSREAGEEAAAGGVIVTLYGLARGYIPQAGAGAGGQMGRYVPMQRYVPMRGNPPALMNRGADPTRAGLGYMNPARITPAQARFMGSRA
jgi:hypothetical protein